MRAEKLTANVLDYPRPGLCPEVWNEDNSLKPEIKDDILEKINGYLSDVSWIETIRILGSLTSWQYNSKSDLDVHVVVDWDKLKEEYPGLDKDELDEVVDVYKDSMREEQWKVLGTEHPLEISFETPDKQATTTDGIYNLLTDEWAQGPRTVESDFDPEAIYSSIVDEAEAIAEELDIAIGDAKRDISNIEALEEAMQTMDSASRTKFQKRLQERTEELEKELLEIMEKAYDVSEERDVAYEADSDENLTFKYLQKFGYIWLWKNLEKIMGEVDEEPELEQTDLPEIKKVIDQGWCEMDDKRAAIPRGTKANLTKKVQKLTRTASKKAKIDEIKPVSGRTLKRTAAKTLKRKAQEPGKPKKIDNKPKAIETGEDIARATPKPLETNEPIKPPLEQATTPENKPLKMQEAPQKTSTPAKPELRVMKPEDERTPSPAAPKERRGDAWKFDDEVERNVVQVLPDLVPDYLELDYSLYHPNIIITHLDSDEGIVFGDVFVELINKETGVKDGEMRLTISGSVEDGVNYEPEGPEYWAGLTDVDIAIEDMKKWGSKLKMGKSKLQISDPIIAASQPISTKVVCSWCGAHISGDQKVERTSHGICPACEAKVNKEMDEADAKEKTAAISLQPVYVANRVLEMVSLEKLKGMEFDAIQHEIYTWLTRNQLKYTKEDVRKIHDQLSKQTGIEAPPPKEPKPEDVEGVGPTEKPVLPPTSVEDINKQKAPPPAAEPIEEREPVQGQEPVIKTPIETPTARPQPKIVGKMMVQKMGNRFVAVPVHNYAELWTTYARLITAHPEWKTDGKNWVIASTISGNLNTGKNSNDFNTALEIEAKMVNDVRIAQIKKLATDPREALLALANDVIGLEVDPNKIPFMTEKQADTVAKRFAAETGGGMGGSATEIYGLMVSWGWVKPADAAVHTDTAPAKGGTDNAVQPAARDRDRFEDAVETGTKDVFPNAGAPSPSIATNSARQLAKDLLKLGSLNEDEIAEDLMKQYKLTEAQAFDVLDEAMTLH